jgi:hypothetical protein
MATPTLPNLHDAVLERLQVDWSAATVTVELHPVPGEPIVLTAYGVRELRVDHWEPWGPSAFVNSTEIHEAAAGHLRLRLEMQSGDNILIVAEQFELTQPEPGGSPATRMG